MKHSFLKTFGKWIYKIFNSSNGVENSEPLTHPLQENKISQDIRVLLNLPVREVMTPRADIIWIDIDKPFQASRKEILKYPYNFFPVCQHDLDKILGKISAKQILMSFAEKKKFYLEKHLTPVLFVAPSLSCQELLIQMRDSKLYVAIIVDEFGGVDGLLTVSDIIKKIIGDIEVNTAQDIKHVHQNKDHTAIVEGRLSLDEFEQKFGSFLTPLEKQEDPETIGGLILTIAGRVPARGELIEHESGLVFEILNCDARRVTRVRIHNLDKIKS